MEKFACLIKERGSGPSTDTCSTPEHRDAVFSVRLDLNQSRGVLASRLLAALLVEML